VVERLVILFPYGTVDYDDLPEKFQFEGGELPEAVTTVIEESPQRKELQAPIKQTDNSPEVENVTPVAAITELDALPEEGLDLKEHLANLEYLLIKQALDDSAGVVAHAANKLKMRRTTLVEKMRKYGIQREAE
jgi:sigma-54 specific flagellar transcriptional regulator A